MKPFDRNSRRLAVAALCAALLGNPPSLFADAASNTVRNFAAMEDRFLSRFKTVGTTESGGRLPGSGGNAGVGEELVGPTTAATEEGKKSKEKDAEKPGSLISGTDAKGSVRGWGIEIGEDICLRIDSSAERDSYIVYARHIDSGRVYAKDADGESPLFCENEDWIGEEGILAKAATVTKGRDDLLGQPCGGRQTAVWTDLSAAVILDTKRAVANLRKNAGDGGEPEIRAWAKEAAEWFGKAEKGDADARYHLGRLYRLGQGLPRDAEMAAEWFRMAANQEQAAAQAELGFAYAQGSGVPKNAAMSRELLRLAAAGLPNAAESGDVFAQTLLGRLYAQGAGCRELKGDLAWRNRKGADPGCLEKDEGQAAAWLMRAAAQGHADAQARLGVKFLTGIEIRNEGRAAGLVRDERQAAEWLRRAGEQGDGAAQFMLGMMYMHGRGLPKDPRQGAEWLRRAEERGVNGAGQAMTLLTN